MRELDTLTSLKISITSEENYATSFIYNSDNEKAKMVVTDSGNTILTRWYVSGSYMEETAGGATTKYTFIGGDAYTAPVVAVTSVGTTNYYYLLRDHLGNITHQVNTSNTVVAEYSYDAWGRRRNPSDWSYNLTNEPALFAGRGFTGHEHLPWFNLINMNGRLYDPLVGRMLSPDPNVQIPDYTQNYNRYSYALNNPLVNTDPDGEFIFSALLPGIGVFIDAACWGAVIGGAGYTASVAFSDGGFNNWNWGQFGKSAGIGAISGAVTAGIGDAFKAVGSNGIAGEFARAYTHGFANGMISEFTGGDFTTGFAAGGLSSLAGSAFMTYGPSSTLGNYTFSGLAGGIGAELTGGNFWEGAATGLMNAGLNHLQQGLNKLIYNKTFNRIGYVPLDKDLGYQMANYKMRLKIWQNGDDQLSLMAETFNTPVADGHVVANADASLMVNNKQVAAQVLSLKGDYKYFPDGFIPIGEAYFQMPTGGNVSINFRGGWNVYLPGGAAVPIYHPTLWPFSININQRIVIR